MRFRTTLMAVVTTTLATLGAVPQNAQAASISANSYPTTVSPGQQVDIRWTVSGSGKVKYNAVQWGSSSSSMLNCTISTLDKPYSTSFFAPAKGDIYFRVQTRTSRGYFRGKIHKISVGSSGFSSGRSGSSGRSSSSSNRNSRSSGRSLGSSSRSSGSSGRRTSQAPHSTRSASRGIPSAAVQQANSSPLQTRLKFGHSEYGAALKTDLKDWKKGRINLGAEIGVELDAARFDATLQLGDPEALSTQATGSVKLASIAGRAAGDLALSKQGFKAEGELKGELMLAKAEGEAALAWMAPKWMPWIGGTTFELGAGGHVGAGLEGKVTGKAKFDSSGWQLKGGAAAAVGVGGGAELFFNVKFPSGAEITIWIHLEQDADGKMRITQAILAA